MATWIVIYEGFGAFVVVVAILTTLVLRSRRLRQPTRIPPGFVRTDEVFIDPTTGIRQRVWFNQVTGERFYETLPRD